MPIEKVKCKFGEAFIHFVHATDLDFWSGKAGYVIDRITGMLATFTGISGSGCS